MNDYFSQLSLREAALALDHSHHLTASKYISRIERIGLQESYRSENNKLFKAHIPFLSSSSPYCSTFMNSTGIFGIRSF